MRGFSDLVKGGFADLVKGGFADLVKGGFADLVKGGFADLVKGGFADLVKGGFAAGVVWAAFATTAPAWADSREIAGASLVLNNTRSEDTVISTDPTLAAHVRVSMDGDLNCLTLTGSGSGAVIGTSRCSDDAGTLRIDVPPQMPLTITSNSSGDIRISDTAAPVILNLGGSGDVTGGRTGPLVLNMHGSSDVQLGDVEGLASLEMIGSGDVRLAGVFGTLVLKHHGSGDLAVGHVDAPSVEIESTGSGDMVLGGGHVDVLNVHMHGDGDLAVAAPVRDGDVSAYGGGDVKIGVVSGTLHRASGGDSGIYVGGPSVVDTLIGKVATEIATHHRHTVTVTSSSHTHAGMVVVGAVALFIVWRIARRRPVPGAPARSMGAGPGHPGVVAVCDALKRVEDRLGRVEGYVTSREFDLQQKFKKL